MILDQYGNPIDIKSLSKPQATPAAQGVRRVGQNTSTSGLDPLKAARILRAAEEGDAAAYLGIAEEMEEKYLHYNAQLATRKRAVAGIIPTITPASDSPKDIEIADFVRAQIPTIRAAIPHLMDALGKGYSVCEILWDTGGKQWFPKEIVWRDPRWFVFDKLDGQTLRLKSDRERDGDPLLPGHYLIHKAAAKSGLPIRGGLARGAIWAFLFHNFSIRDWVTFIEQFGKPLRLGRYDSSLEEAKGGGRDLEVLFEAVRSLGSDAAAVLPNSMTIEFPDAGRAKGDSNLWLSLLEYLDRQVSKLVLGQTLTADTSSTGGGAFALGKVHNDVRIDILEDDAGRLSETINRDLVKILVDLNFAGVAEYPEFRLFVEKPEDLKARAEIVQKAVAIGQPVPVKWFSETFGIPLPEEGEDVLGIPADGQGMRGESGDGGMEGKAVSGSEKYDAGLINAYSMGADRLARLGVDIPVSFVRDVFGIPRPKSGEALLTPPANETQQALQRQNHIAGLGNMVSAHATENHEPNAAAQSVDRLETDTAPALNDWLDTIEAMLEAAGSLEEFQAMLAAGFPKLDSGELSQKLAEAFAALELRGRFEASQAGGK